MYFRHLKCVCHLFVQSVGRFCSFIVRCSTFYHLNFSPAGICIGVCCWWPRRSSCRTPRSNETVSGFRLYCMCSCAWHSNITLTEHETGNITLVREQGKRLDICGSDSWRSNEFYDQPPSPFLLSFSGSLARQCDVRSGRSWRLPCPFLFIGQIWENFS